MTRKIRSYQAITTRYVGASNVKGSRIIAKAAAGRVIVSYNDSLNSENAHAEAAAKLAAKFGWKGKYYIGGMPDDRGYVFICPDDQPAFEL